MASIKNLSVEHHRETLGIGEASPRISWNVETTIQSWTQKSYEIEVTRDSGKPERHLIQSDQSILVDWPSQPLCSAECASLRLRVTDSDGAQTEWSTPLVIESGLLAPADWDCVVVQTVTEIDIEGPVTPALFKREFSISKEIAKARLYITSHGIYEAELNGIRVGDHVLAPGWTPYEHELTYQTFDVTGQLLRGENAIGVHVGEGWYAGRLGWEQKRHFWGNKLGVIAQLVITYIDGSVDKIVTDDEWQYSEMGPLTRSEIYNGEDYDARKVDLAWSKSGKSSIEWKRVTTGRFDKHLLRSPDGPPIRRVEEIKPAAIFKSPSNKIIVDFGQNLVGWLKVAVRGPPGTEIKFVHTEVLEKGEVGTRPLRTATATDRLTLSGGRDIWEARFTFHGFRFVEITNWPETDISDGSIIAIVIHTDMERTGYFECSNSLINKLHENIVWSMRGNFVGIPTDCPARDERLGWTGDIQAFAPSAVFLYRCSGMLKSWLRNLTAETDEKGVPPVVSPNILGSTMDPQAIWCDAVTFVPYNIYLATGDLVLLKTQFQSMIDWLETGVVRDESGLWNSNDFQLGDWLDPAAPPDDPGDARTDSCLVADAFLIASTDIVIKVANTLGKQQLAAQYTTKAENLRKAFSHKYMAPSGRIIADSQTAIALALHFNLIPTPEQESVATNRLVELIRKKSRFKIATGFAGTPILGHALTKVGQTQLFYRVLYERKCPSWLYPVTMGATTVWERWDSMLPSGEINPGQMTSFNHYALGAVADWIHTTISGLKALEPGWRRFAIKPVPGGDLTWANARFQSPYGLIESKWEIFEGSLRLEFVVPPGTSAEVALPGDDMRVFGSGCYEIKTGYKKPEWPIKAIYHKYMKPDEDGLDDPPHMK